jgi:hypothetical protein
MPARNDSLKSCAACLIRDVPVQGVRGVASCRSSSSPHHRSTTAVCSRQPEKGHDDLALSTTLSWISDRFDDGPVINSCAAPAAPEVSEEGA